MSRGSRRGLLTIALLVGLGAAAPGAAQAQTRARANAVFYHQGPYAGKIAQVVPKPYTGRISLLVSQRKITGLTVTFGVACQKLGWVRDQDPMPTFTVAIGPAGGFSYTGKLAGRRMRLSGIFNGHRVVGSFFQSFWFGHDFCTMERPAFFTALS
jgi:hypothetical protein